MTRRRENGALMLRRDGDWLGCLVLGLLVLMVSCGGQTEDRDDNEGGAGAVTGGASTSGGHAGTGGRPRTGGTGGGQSAECPRNAPSSGAVCPRSALLCSYGNSACICASWVGQLTWVCSDLGSCPASQPRGGSACDDIANVCAYNAAGQLTASTDAVAACLCLGDEWACTAQ